MVFNADKDNKKEKLSNTNNEKKEKEKVYETEKTPNKNKTGFLVASCRFSMGNRFLQPWGPAPPASPQTLGAGEHLHCCSATITGLFGHFSAVVIASVAAVGVVPRGQIDALFEALLWGAVCEGGMKEPVGASGRCGGLTRTVEGGGNG